MAETQLTWTPRMDWSQSHDLRSFDHLYQGVGLHSRMHSSGAVLDQGNVGACTGFGSTAALASYFNPGGYARKRFDNNAFALAVYELATSRDEWAGDWPTQDEGSSVNGAMRALRDLGWISRWKWADTLDKALAALSVHGSLVIGAPWYASMDLASSGRVRVDTSSAIVGGHCFCLNGIDVAGQDVRMRNSWGDHWGSHGEALMSWVDLKRLMDNGAEIAVPYARN